MNFLSTELGADPVIVEGVLNAPAAKVYQAWTTPDAVLKWFGLDAGAMISAEIDLKIGGKWRFVMHQKEEARGVLQGEYLVIEPDERLEFSWTYVTEYADGREEATTESRVIITFTPRGETTLLKLRHESIIAEEGRIGVGHGWGASFAHLEDWLAELLC